MQLPDDTILHLDRPSLTLTFDMLLSLPGSRLTLPSLRDSARQLFSASRELWQPQALMRWLPVCWPTPGQLELAAGGDGDIFHLGHSSQFITSARLALVAVYSAGPGLENRARQLAAERHYLESYLLEQIGLLVLNQVGLLVCRQAETTAQAIGWGVGPFLSPGSVHGWELMEQASFCRLLPIDRASISCSTEGVLCPLNSIACLIGIGPDYPSTTVGSTCTVCASRDHCPHTPSS
jgi:hypothetical protein